MEQLTLHKNLNMPRMLWTRKKIILITEWRVIQPVSIKGFLKKITANGSEVISKSTI